MYLEFFRMMGMRLVEHAIRTAKQNKQKAISLDCMKGNGVPQKMCQTMESQLNGIF